MLFTFAFNAGGQGRFVDVLAMEKILVPFVLFVCRHNTGRSQMAEAYLRHFAGERVEVASAGTLAADEPHPGVIDAMAEDGIDVHAARPKLLDPALAQRADRIITMGCDVEGASTTIGVCPIRKASRPSACARFAIRSRRRPRRSRRR